MRLFVLIVFLACVQILTGKVHKKVSLSSPNEINEIYMMPFNDEGLGFQFQIKYKGEVIISPSQFSIVSPELDFSKPFKIMAVEKSSEDNYWTSSFSERCTIPNKYNELKVYLESVSAKLNVILRAYNEGIAFAYEIPEQGGVREIGLDEKINYTFEEDYPVWSTPERAPGVLTAQGEYKKIPLSQLKKGCERPLLIEMGSHVKVALAEAALVDYARLSFNRGESEYSILSTLDGKMLDHKQDTITGAILAERSEGSKVHKKLPFQSPWRVIMTGDSYGKLLEQNYIIQNLNSPSALADESWIVPGKVLRETTLTTQGAYAAIDFVASHHMQYIMFDAGWYGDEMKNESDATTVTLDPKRSKGPLDMEAVTAYAKNKDIGVILYVNRRALEKQLDDILPLFKKWGVAGIKFGFVRVGDQDATAWLHEAIKKAAQYQLIVDVHDEYRPTGVSRTYPNLLTQEGIAGDETTVSNEHTLISMFTRLLAGAADNTVCYYNKRVEKMGSHASQLAKTVCIFSPLQFLYWYDKAPAAPVKNDGLWGDTRTIGNEPELAFFNSVPTTWDETKVIVGEIGKIAVIARRKGKDWYMGGINGNQERALSLDFSFLEDGTSYSAKLYTDDEKAVTRTQVAIKELELQSIDSMELEIKANSGFAMHIVEK
ncbi:glycoside hydrolase family 97 protein [Saccharicrinis fermentans]|uniref:Retaining alpha-galactosidase n=1 Tax=Saccharicrinis fermentans DSM 9555 = JCM 21142 TaxID=869213 RepID=W7YBY4_9BACT|nr:glycoside hydrolase family 97 protein [Saccharicrinis fermentans]GAF01991.1 retaining alpha-galactosidase precursor [Saccharicrinis fermentans DSM 9555 = JCM 21142]